MPKIRKPKMYLDTSRTCCVCGSNKTSYKLINRVFWHRDIDDNGKWTGKWKCHKCYLKEYCKRRNEERKCQHE